MIFSLRKRDFRENDLLSDFLQGGSVRRFQSAVGDLSMEWLPADKQIVDTSFQIGPGRALMMVILCKETDPGGDECRTGEGISDRRDARPADKCHLPAAFPKITVQ